MARHEGGFGGTGQEPLSLLELLDLLGNAAQGDSRSREDAIACYLSRGEGWREAAKMLGGTFANGTAELRKNKAD